MSGHGRYGRKGKNDLGLGLLVCGPSTSIEYGRALLLLFALRETDMSDPEVTRHARKRIKQRRGSKHAEKEFTEALEKGVHLKEAKGNLRRYLYKYAKLHESTAVVYKGMVYWHYNGILATVTPLPFRFMKIYKDIMEKK